MKTNQYYIEINKSAWNNVVDTHYHSDFYDMRGFLAGNTSLNPIELEMLGDISGKSILHLQCHFGQDTLSLARMGAKVTGVDLSDVAIEKAKELAEELKIEADFVCCDLYDTPNFIDEKFDIVYTSYGTIGWLPDLDKWANIISNFLKPNGKFIFVEFHPFVWMFDNNFQKLEYSYFKSEPIVEEEVGTYADKNAKIVKTTISWNHSFSDILNSLIKCGIRINSFDEYDYSPYNCFHNMVEFEPKKFRIKDFDNKLPLVYAINGSKK